MALINLGGTDDETARILHLGPAIVVELIPVESADLKRRVYLQPGKPVIIGRASNKNSASKVLPSERNTWFACPVISRQHAELEARDGVVLLKDLGSMHGTYKNGIQLEKNVQTTLRAGDKVQLGTNVSRGHEFFRGINLIIKYSASASPDLATSSRTFEVPTATDDDDSDSDYGSDSSDIFHQTDYSTSSPQTSPASKHELVEGTPQKPITIDADREQVVIDLVGVEFGFNRDSPGPSESDKKPKDGIDIRRFMHPVVDQEFFPARQPSPPKKQWIPPAGSNIPVTELRQEGSYKLRDIPLNFSLMDSIAVPNKQWSKSPDVMAIPNMLAPAVEVTPDTTNDVADPFKTVLDEVDTILALHLPPKQAETATSSKKRKRVSTEAEKAESASSSSSKLPVSMLLEAKGDEILSEIKKSRRAPNGAGTTRFCCTFDDGFELPAQPSADVHRPAKRRRTTPASVAAHIMHETAKYSFGAAVGAVGTFAFLASPLGGRFADWLGTI